MVGGAILCSGNLLLGPEHSTKGDFLKIEWMITNVTTVRSPVRAESGGLG